MAQGPIKKSKPTTAKTSRRQQTAAPKKGARTIAPRKANLIKQQKVTKKLSAGLTARTERSLAERAGHLEMLKGGKKENGKGKKEGKKSGS